MPHRRTEGQRPGAHRTLGLLLGPHRRIEGLPLEGVHMTLPGPLGLHRSPQGRLMEVGRKLKEQGPVGEPGVLKGVEKKQKELVVHELVLRGPAVLVAGNFSQVQLQVVGNH